MNSSRVSQRFPGLQLSSLTLYAASSGVEIDRERLIAFLASRKLIGASLSATEFLAGDDFFKSISFLGCSPAIVLDPEEGGQHIRISIQTLDVPVLYVHQRARPPLCVNCRASMDDWLAAIDAASGSRIECARCKQQVDISRLHFRKRACYTRFVIQIQPVFESEAIPDAGLLAALEDTFGAEFKYAYT